MKKLFLLILLVLILSIYSKTITNNELIIYTSVDQNISEEILNNFEKETGIKVKPVYDVEASKTTGLVNRLILEKDNPQADIFWSSEIIMTLKLKEENVLTEYKNNFIHAFGNRARVLIINTNLINKNEPNSIYDFNSEEFKDYKKAVANPLFGTSRTHLIALSEIIGEDSIIDFYKDLKNHNTSIVNGNSVVRDLVASGEAAFGITDTDDALVAKNNNKPVKIVFLDQNSDLGTLIIPNTVALIKKPKIKKEAKEFIDYLMNDKVENTLIKKGFLFKLKDNIKKTSVDFETAYENRGDVIKRIEALLTR